MTAERWAQIEELFRRVLESAPEERARLLEEAGSTDPELRREVESLLLGQPGAEEHLRVYQGGNIPAKILRLDVATGAKAPWRDLAPNSKTGLAVIPSVRVGADCQSSAYSAWYLPGDLWIADGLR